MGFISKNLFLVLCYKIATALHMSGLELVHLDSFARRDRNGSKSAFGGILWCFEINRFQWTTFRSGFGFSERQQTVCHATFCSCTDMSALLYRIHLRSVLFEHKVCHPNRSREVQLHQYFVFFSRRMYLIQSNYVQVSFHMVPNGRPQQSSLSAIPQRSFKSFNNLFCLSPSSGDGPMNMSLRKFSELWG